MEVQMAEKKKMLNPDVLVIGTGAAGLRAAIEARRYGAEVLVVDKSLIGVNNNTVFAGGGLKAALPGIMDESMNKGYQTPEEHIADTIRYGAYLNNQKLVEILGIEAPGRLLELPEFGVEHFENLRLHHDASAKYGGKLTKPMAAYCKKLGVRLRPHTTIYDFVVEDDAILGAVAFDSLSGRRLAIRTNAIIVATGGAGEVYLRNNTVSQTTGEAFSMAFRVGAELIGMELVQIDPYILAEPTLPHWYVHPCKARFLAVLRNADGEPFLTKHIPLKGKLEDPFPVRYGVHPPDVRETISRAMYLEVLEGRGENGAVMLDCTKVPEEEWSKDPADLHSRNAILRGFDLQKNMIHMLPGAIHNLGGIRINERCEASVSGLYAAGECAGLVHGSGRLGGNALSDCIVFGAIAGRESAKYVASIHRSSGDDELFIEREALLDDILTEKEHSLAPKEIKNSIKNITWNCAGPVRWEEGLKEGLEDLEKLQDRDMPLMQTAPSKPLHIKEAIEAYHMANVGEMIIRSALMRRESRGGGHYRLDYTEEDNKNWFKNILIRDEKGQMVLETIPVEVTRFKPPVA
jgi:succinate dehydrogenase/fumarate reductase flavoprotein subunit